MRKVLWKKCPERRSLCDIRLTCDNQEARNLIENYLNTIDLCNQDMTGISPVSWVNFGEPIVYLMPREFEALERMTGVFGIELVEEV
jgi:hypothetical protein